MREEGEGRKEGEKEGEGRQGGKRKERKGSGGPVTRGVPGFLLELTGV